MILDSFTLYRGLNFLMDKFSILALSKLPFVTSSYSNRWWARALKRSIEINGNAELRTLTELQLQLEVAKAKDEYIYYPVFPVGFKPEPGLYHLNVQTSNMMFTGWMAINADNSAAWWGQGGGDSVNVGYAGHQNCVSNFDESDEFGDQIQWLGASHTKERFPGDVSIFDILKPFD